jgi:deoxyadenosine/deoxycytidine kinase
VAITGPIGVGKTSLARQIAHNTGARLIEEPLDDMFLTQFYGDPPGMAPRTQLQFLRLRADLLEFQCWGARNEWTVSDFHFAQSLAFATLWLGDQELMDFERRCQRAAITVQTPRFSVLLDAPTDLLLERIARRGRRYERGLDATWINRLRIALQHQFKSQAAGPVLRLSAVDLEAARLETLAAMTSSH